MIQLIPIKTCDADYARVEKLFEFSFPPEERRSLEVQRHVTDEKELFTTFALYDADRFAGLLTCWQGPGFVYVEHFATSPEVRGRGIGSEVLHRLSALSSDPVVLEVELPRDELSRRRIGFYERNGFRLWSDSFYVQPPYQAGCAPLPLHLMVRGEGLDEQRDFERIRRWLYAEVYGNPDFQAPEGLLP